MLHLSRAQTLPRPSAVLNAGALVLVALGVTVSVVLVREAAAGGSGRDMWHADRRGGGTLADPMRWIRHSGQSFQRLMSMLAVRSAAMSGRVPRPLPSPDEEDEPQGWPEDWRPEDRHELPPPPARRNGGEAKAGPNRSGDSGARVKDWYERRPPSCRRSTAVKPGRRGWYVVRDGDTLWSIAEAHYGYGGAYRRILHANRERIADSDVIYTWQRLYIPHWRWAPCYAERGAGAEES